MTFVTSQLVFGSYTFPASFSPQSRENTIVYDQSLRMSKTFGEVGIYPTFGTKNVHVKGTIGGSGSVDSSGSYILTLDQAKAELELLQAALCGGLQNLTMGASDGRYLVCQAKDLKVTPMEGVAQTALEIDLEFEAPDPRWLANTAQTATTPFSGGFAYTNNGSTTSYPIITINGPMTVSGGGQTFEFVVTAGNSRVTGHITMNLGPALGGGDVLVIDCTPQNRAHWLQLNGADRQDLMTTYSGSTGDASTYRVGEWLPYIQPGTFGLNVQATTGPANGSTFVWRDAWGW